MKLLIVSDIHGFVEGAMAYERIIEDEKPDRIVLLGDLLAVSYRRDEKYEYNPEKVIEVLNTYSDITVSCIGNCDREFDMDSLDFEFKEYWIEKIGDKDFYFNHGDRYNIDNIPPVGDVLVFGHYHIGMIEDVNGVVCINPGSISVPRNNLERSYIIVDDNKIYLKNIDGEVIKNIEL